MSQSNSGFSNTLTFQEADVKGNLRTVNQRQRVLTLHNVQLIQFTSSASVTSLHSLNVVTSENIRFTQSTAFSSSFLHRLLRYWLSVTRGLFFSNKLHMRNIQDSVIWYMATSKFSALFCLSLLRTLVKLGVQDNFSVQICITEVNIRFRKSAFCYYYGVLFHT